MCIVYSVLLRLYLERISKLARKHPERSPFGDAVDRGLEIGS